MSWSYSILLQIVFGTFNNIWVRKVSTWHPKSLFATSFIVYGIVAIVGVVFTLYNNDWSLPSIPSIAGIRYVIGEGILIPISWLAQYKLISLIGASNAVVAKTLNYVTVAVFGFVFLAEPIGVSILLGGPLLLAGAVTALSIRKADSSSHTHISISKKVSLLVISSVALGFGLVFEKLAITEIGVWSYTMYGWSAQFLGATILFILFGRKEIPYITRKFSLHASITGLMTSLTGVLFVYSLSKGLLSSTILVASASVSLTAFVAIWLLRERNQLLRRAISIALAVAGLIIMLP